MEVTVKVPLRSNIDAIISERGLKKKWIAQQMGISNSYLSQMTKTDENGILKNAMSAEYLVRLAHTIGVKVDDLVSYEVMK